MSADHAERHYSRFRVPAIEIGVVVLFGILFMVDRHAYLALLTGWMLRPFPTPFIDWQFVPAAIECWSHGVDVYTNVPCYDVIPATTYSYSPLLLRFTFLPTDPVSVMALGVVWSLLFCISQAYLPAPRTRWELCLTLLVAFSSLTAFAIERSNFDVIVFLLVVLGSQLWLGGLRLRLLAYAVFLFAGMLKFYPLVLLGLALRERPRVFVQIMVVATVIVAVASFGVRDELVAAARNVPTGSFFTDIFGAVNLPFGLPELAAYVSSKLTGHPALPAAFGWMAVPAYVALVWAALFGAAVLAFRAGVQEGVAALELPRKSVLLVGAALVTGCFFAGQSIGYRGIFLILLMPGLFELRRTLPRPGSRCILATIYCIVFAAWVLTIKFMSKALGLTRSYELDLGGFSLLHWTLHELSWWFIVTVLLAVLMSFAATSSVGAWARALVSRQSHRTTVAP